MEVANASLYDGATSVWEAISISLRVTGRQKIVVDKSIHPHYRQVIKSYSRQFGFELLETEPIEGKVDLERLSTHFNRQQDLAGVIVQLPNFFGILQDFKGLADMIHAAGGLLTIIVNPLALAWIKPPGEMCADLVVGEGQVLGSPLSFGGPYLGLFAAKKEFLRKIPGRIVGETQDSRGRRGFVLTLQAREQHIRREKATSNICTNESLQALRAAIYLSALGKEGLRELAELNFQKAHYLKERMKEIPGVRIKWNEPVFNEFVVELPLPAKQVLDSIARDDKIFAGLPLGEYYPDLQNSFLTCVTEKRTKEEMDRLQLALRRRL
jgi:glycine dehydrogenase subunit 1